MTAKSRAGAWQLDIATSATVLLSTKFATTPKTSKKIIDQWFITSVGSGTLTITPIIEGATSHKVYVLTNDSTWLDFPGIEDFSLQETSTNDPVSVSITAYIGN